jgi:CDP-paratose 2-epimerase
MEDRSILITGGAGFVGTNVALSYLAQSQPVHIFDNLLRPGAERNIEELLRRFAGSVQFTKGDVRDKQAVRCAVQSANEVYHLAAQVAVTSSLENPLYDAETNLLGTLNVLESVRQTSRTLPVLFTSTNKVYGELSELTLHESESRFRPADRAFAASGIDEQQRLAFLSPYGCSKGSADQYVLDYARSYGLAATVFRMSCIYGPYQMGSEDQGWVAHFMRQALKGEPITVYGNGKQVRDLLYVDDLVNAMRLALNKIGRAAGHAFNIGGGPLNSVSLQEVISKIEQLSGQQLRIQWGAERLGDQRWYVSNTEKARTVLGWKPEVEVHKGLSDLFDWYSDRPALTGRSQMQVA